MSYYDVGTNRAGPLRIDIETYSPVSLKDCGVYAYADSPEFEILLIGFAYGDGPVEVISLATGEEFPDWLVKDIMNPEIHKTAFNAQFERTCLSKAIGIHLPPEGWYCTMVQASFLSLPRSLEMVASVLGTKEQKDRRGEELIRFFSVPCKPTSKNGYRERNLPEHDPDKWELFQEYNRQDVETERDIARRMAAYPISERELELYWMDQRINDRGIMVDRQMVGQAITCSTVCNERMQQRAYELTGLPNPNSTVQLKEWLEEKGLKAETLAKSAVQNMIDDLEKTGSDEEVLELLKLRLQMSKSSVKKYQAAERSLCHDDRVHGMFKFLGANRTGRWAGAIVQLQNLPQNHLETLEEAREILKDGDFDLLELIYENVPAVLSELVRTMFIPKPGCRFIIADFSAIEARVLAWMSGEEWRLENFRNNGDIYCASASRMFGVPVEKHGVNKELRQKGKIAELALGYGGGVGALTSMGALDMGLKEEELPELVTNWRESNPAVTKFWWEVDRAANQAIDTGNPQQAGRLLFGYDDSKLQIRLPSGRILYYQNPRRELNEANRMELTYDGLKGGTWGRIETYGPKLVENCIQAISRDILAEAMLRVDKAGFDIVAHVHDEMVLEVPIGKSSVEEICSIMTVLPEWADDSLPLNADGFESFWYRKE